MASLTKKSRRIEYPTSDGKPMAETDFHRVLIVDLIDQLDYWFREDPKTYVSGDLLVFYEKGNRRKHVAPDVFVVPGAVKKLRENFLIWEERKRLKWITEVTSKTTKNEDTAKKFVLYRDVLKVDEYFLFDPFGDYLKPELKGYRLVRGDYVPIESVDGRLPSEILGLHLEAFGRRLLLYDPTTGQYVPTHGEREEEEKQRADDEKQRADDEKRRADDEKRRADEEKRRADDEKRRADDEKQRADDEKQRASLAEREVERLRQELGKHRRRNGA